MQVKQVIAFIVMILFPMLLIALTIVRIVTSKAPSGLERWERDYAQAMYWVITMLGGLGVSTCDGTWVAWISFDGACGMFMGSSCWLMSSRWFLDIASETMIRCLDLVANVTAFSYLLSLYQRLFPEPEDQTHMD